MALHGFTPLERFFQQILLRHALVDQADFDRFLGTETTRAENHFTRQALAEDARQVLGRADSRAGADFGAGLAEHCIFGGNHQIAPQRKFMSAAHAPAVDHRDHRDWQAADGHRQSEHAVVPHVSIGEIEAFHRIEIAAGRKRLVTLAGDHGTDDRRIFTRRFQRIDHFVQRLLAEGVEHFLAVDGDPCHLVLHFVQDVGVISLYGLFDFCSHGFPHLKDDAKALDFNRCRQED